MDRFVWNVYEQFHCIADRCPDSCCKSWIVDVDEASAAYYRGLEGPLGDRLRQFLKTEDGASFLELENDRCPMWREDKLCQIQAELGHDSLCQVCREYPRLIMDYGGFAEWGLELSCPEAARLIFQGLSVRWIPDHGGETPEYDPDIMEILGKSRWMLLNFWKNTDQSVPNALAITLMYAHRLQLIPGGNVPEALNSQICYSMAERYAGPGNLDLLLDFFREQEILTEEWKQRLDHPNPGKWDPKLRHLAQYLISRYWLQSVWDFDLVCRVKFILAACILVNALGGDTVKTAQLFSKEIENDPQNREVILDAAYSHPAFTDANLLGLLIKRRGKAEML